MKSTDYMPRAGFLETQLAGSNLIGAEIGVDLGSHAESLLINCDIQKLCLIDPWESEYCYGYCKGRLETKGYINKVEFIRKISLIAATYYHDNYFDFLYFDQHQDYEIVKEDLNAWWELLKPGGMAAWRGYPGYPRLAKAIDEFLVLQNFRETHLKFDAYTQEIILIK